jgi:VanZ family protein
VKRLLIEYWLPLILWLTVIFLFSTDTFSSERTGGLIVPALKFLFPSLAPGELTFWHGVIRKLGHITEYFILAVFAYRSLKRGHPDDFMHAKLKTIGFVFVAAVFDELHQRETLFRTASPMDVGYDCFGAVFALSLITVYEAWRLRTRSIL